MPWYQRGTYVARDLHFDGNSTRAEDPIDRLIEGIFHPLTNRVQILKKIIESCFVHVGVTVSSLTQSSGQNFLE